MLLTSLSYWIVQGVAFAYLADPTGNKARSIEHKLSLAGFIVCTIFLILYCVYQVLVPKLAIKRQNRAEEKMKQTKEKLRAIRVLKYFPVLQKSLKQEDQEKAVALSFAERWRDKARAKMEEASLLEENKKEKEEEEEEEEQVGGSFYKEFFIAVAQMLVGTGLQKLYIFLYFDEFLHTSHCHVVLRPHGGCYKHFRNCDKYQAILCLLCHHSFLLQRF